MKPDEPLPLWLESIPDREPWRRGRDAAVFLSLVIVLGAIGLITWSILLGDLAIFLVAAGLGVVALLLLYLIWIGQNWPRWIVAPCFAVAGFASVIWSIIYGNGPLFLAGLFDLTIFCYLALAPSVYAFARHQREHVRLFEAAMIGGVFLLMAANVGSVLYGFYVYDSHLQNQATAFAATTFNRVFRDHDEAFLRLHLREAERPMTARAFVEGIKNSLGQPRWVGELRGVFTTRLAQRRLLVTGFFQVPVLFRDGETPIWINLEVSQPADDWQIDHIGWEYNPRKLRASP